MTMKQNLKDWWECSFDLTIRLKGDKFQDIERKLSEHFNSIRSSGEELPLTATHSYWREFGQYVKQLNDRHNVEYIDYSFFYNLEIDHRYNGDIHVTYHPLRSPETIHHLPSFVDLLLLLTSIYEYKLTIKGRENSICVIVPKYDSGLGVLSRAFQIIGIGFDV